MASASSGMTADGFAVALAVEVGEAADRPAEEPPEDVGHRRRRLRQRARHVGLLRLVVGVRHPPQRRAEHHQEEGALVVGAVERQDRVPQRLQPAPLGGAEPVAEVVDVGHRAPAAARRASIHRAASSRPRSAMRSWSTGVTLARAMNRASGSMSTPMLVPPRRIPSTSVVPEPMNGSSATVARPPKVSSAQAGTWGMYLAAKRCSPWVNAVVLPDRLRAKSWPWSISASGGKASTSSKRIESIPSGRPTVMTAPRRSPASTPPAPAARCAAAARR